MHRKKINNEIYFKNYQFIKSFYRVFYNDRYMGRRRLHKWLSWSDFYKWSFMVPITGRIQVFFINNLPINLFSISTFLNFKSIDVSGRDFLCKKNASFWSYNNDRSTSKGIFCPEFLEWEVSFPDKFVLINQKSFF